MFIIEFLCRQVPNPSRLPNPCVQRNPIRTARSTSFSRLEAYFPARILLTNFGAANFKCLKR